MKEIFKMVVEGIVITLTLKDSAESGISRVVDVPKSCAEGVLWEAQGKKQLFKMAHNKSLKLTTIDFRMAASQTETVEVCLSCVLWNILNITTFLRRYQVPLAFPLAECGI